LCKNFAISQVTFSKSNSTLPVSSCIISGSAPSDHSILKFLGRNMSLKFHLKTIITFQDFHFDIETYVFLYTSFIIQSTQIISYCNVKKILKGSDDGV
jgi:hypothetical protein